MGLKFTGAVLTTLPRLAASLSLQHLWPQRESNPQASLKDAPEHRRASLRRQYGLPYHYHAQRLFCAI